MQLCKQCNDACTLDQKYSPVFKKTIVNSKRVKHESYIKLISWVALYILLRDHIHIQKSQKMLSKKVPMKKFLSRNVNCPKLQLGLLLFSVSIMENIFHLLIVRLNFLSNSIPSRNTICNFGRDWLAYFLFLW